MFIRKTQKIDPASKKKYFAYQLVESIRTERGPRQSILLNLGSELELSDEDRKFLANRIEEIISGTVSLFPFQEYIENLAQKYAKQIIRKNSILSTIPKTTEDRKYERVDLDSLEHENARTVGLEHICLETLRILDIPNKLLKQNFTERQVEIAIGLMIGRLAGYTSELETYNWLKNTSALDELLNTSFDSLSLTTVYKVGDLLLKSKDSLEAFLREKERTLFSLKNTLVLYDLTNTYFEGSAKLVEKAAKGRSKEKRSDCPLVTLGAVLNSHGFLLRSDIFSGNVSEPGTLEGILSQLEIDDTDKPVIVLDAGIATEYNVKWLREKHYSYIVCSRKRDQTIPEDLLLQIVSDKQGRKVEAASVRDVLTDELLLYCRSETLFQSELKWRSKAQERFEAGLKKLSDGLTKKNHTKSYQIILEKIGRLKARYKRISQFYTLDIQSDGKEGTASISWKFCNEAADKKFNGGYCLRTHGLSLTDAKLWEIYIMLTKVEDAFRSMKSELGLRPIFHQKGSRVDGHLFITVLGYHVLHAVLWRLEQQGIGCRWDTLRKQMSTQIRVTSSFSNDKGQRIHLRSTTRPESHHQVIYTALDLDSIPGRKVKTIV